MTRATELRNKMTDKRKEKMKELNGAVEPRREFKHVQIESDYIAEFEKNVRKREKMEEKKKKLAEAKNYDNEQDDEKKRDKLEGVWARQNDNSVKLQKKNQSLEKRWQSIRDRQTMTNGQAAFYEKRM